MLAFDESSFMRRLNTIVEQDLPILFQGCERSHCNAMARRNPIVHATTTPAASRKIKVCRRVRTNCSRNVAIESFENPMLIVDSMIDV